MRRSYSSSNQIPLVQKVHEVRTLVNMTRTSDFDMDGLLADIDEYERIVAQCGGRPLRQSRIFELGHGGRATRLVLLMSLGIDAWGIDRDRAHLKGGVRDLIAIASENGIERALKTAVRGLLSDRKYHDRLMEAIRSRGGHYTILPERLLVGDLTDAAALDAFGEGFFDVAYSEDVFEHIPRDGLPNVVSNLKKVLRPGGLALIRPNVFTGITGGHLTEWFPHLVDDRRPRRSEPWEHLRRGRYLPDTHLNRVTRSEYRQLFQRHFDVLDERVKYPDLGRQWLTPDVRQELEMYDEEELFSNTVLWVLRRPADTT